MAESIGGYDYDFIEVLPDDLTCTLCHFAYKQPVQIEDCGHKFCKECFQQMKDHNETNSLDLCCPIDRQLIDVARVFKDKSDERRVFNLMVKCPNFGDKCDWTGELREVLIHETTCCKNETMSHKELKQLLNRMNELESKVKINEQKLVEKDKQIEDQNKQIEEQKEKVLSLQQAQNNMVVPNIKIDNNFSPVSTAYQWKFNPTEVKSGSKLYSPPFYNGVNSYCFQLRVKFVDECYRMILYRFRGKYDSILCQDVKKADSFKFSIYLFKKNGTKKMFHYPHTDGYSIPKHAMRGRGRSNKINKNEIDDFTVDSYVHIHCFFNSDGNFNNFFG